MKSRRILSIIGLTLAAVLLLGIGFAIGRNDEKKTVLVAPTESTAPRLIISAVTFSVISSEVRRGAEIYAF